MSCELSLDTNLFLWKTKHEHFHSSHPLFIQEDDLNSFPMNFSMGIRQYISMIFGTDGKQRVSDEQRQKKRGGGDGQLSMN